MLGAFFIIFSCVYNKRKFYPIAPSAPSNSNEPKRVNLGGGERRYWVEICTPYDADKSLAMQKSSIKRDLLASNHQMSELIGAESMRNDAYKEEIDNFQTTIVLSKPSISYKLDAQNTRLCGYWKD